MIRPDDPLDLVWVQTVRQGYQQTTLIDKGLIEHTVGPDLGPTVYPRLVEFLYFDIQSTWQKSHCVNIAVTGSAMLCFNLLIRINYSKIRFIVN